MNCGVLFHFRPAAAVAGRKLRFDGENRGRWDSWDTMKKTGGVSIPVPIFICAATL